MKKNDNSVILSIIIPVYNSEKYINRCLKSIELQKNYKDIEVVIINDGSCDNSDLVIKEFCASSELLVTYIHTENNGVSTARNIGIEKSHGKYLMFLDSDDYFPDESIEKMIYIIENENLDIVSGNALIVNEKGDMIGNWFLSEERYLKKEDFLVACLKDDPISFSVWGKIIRKSFISNTRFIEKKRVNEDSFFIFELALRKPEVKIIEKEVYCYTKNYNSSSNEDSIEKYFDILFFANRKYQMIIENYPQYQENVKDVVYRAHMNFLINYAKTNDKKYKKEKEESVRYVKTNSLINSTRTFSELFFITVVKMNMYPLFRILYRYKYLIERARL